MLKDSSIFIAGHRGLVGAAVERCLRRSGYANIITRGHDELDLTDQTATEQFFKEVKPEYVFLCAARVGGILANSTYRAEFIYQNIMIAANVINGAYRSGVRKLLNLGSSCIYPKFARQPMAEEELLTGTLEPTNEPYAIAKIAAIKMCRYYNEQYGTNYISAMPANLYGPCDNFDLMNSHVLPALIRKFHLAKLLAEGNLDAIGHDILRWDRSAAFAGAGAEAIIAYLEKNQVTADTVGVWGTGRPRREFLYVDDLAEGCKYLMEHCSFQEIGEFINIGAGEDFTIGELAGMVQEIVCFRGNIVFDSTKPDGTPKKLLSSAKMRALGWTPETGIAEGIRKTYEWYTA